MEQNYIVAIEIGSSKIYGAVASVDAGGRLTVLAGECLHAINSVRYGRVSNVQEVSANVNTVIRKLENNPAVMPHKINGLYISLGGRSFSTTDCSASLEYGKEIEINEAALRRLEEEARFGLTTTKSILELQPRTSYVDNKEVANMVGTVGKRLRMEFTALLCAQDNRNNLERIKLDSPLVKAVSYITRPTAIADLVLTSTERQLGVALVDFGAETTTLSIYKNNALQYAVTLPLGSRNITLDLKTGLNLTEDKAEQVKIDMGTAMNDRHAAPMSAEQAEVNQYVHARAGEIIANVIHQIEAGGFKSADLPSGIVVVGGGARLRNFDQALSQQSKMKVRTGTVHPRIILCNGVDPDHDTDIVALLAAAADRDLNCLEIVQEPTEPVDDTQDDTPAYTGNTGGRRRPDSADILDDDPDDDELGKKPAKEGLIAAWRRKRRERAEQRRQELREASLHEAEELERQRQLDEMAEKARIQTGISDPDEANPDDYEDPDEGEVDEIDIDDEPQRPSIKDRFRNFLTKGADADLDDKN